MPNFKIVTDSTTELSAEEIDKYGITVIPLSSMIDNVLYYDGVTITKPEFLEKMMNSKELPKSSQPAMGTFLDKYNPDQFDILGQMVTTKIDDYNFGYPYIYGKKIYARTLIKRKEAA